MRFEKDLFFKYLRKISKENQELNYIYRLYKNFDLINRIMGEDTKNKEIKLKKFEDSIYTVNNKVLSDKIRIKLELENLNSKMDANNSENVYLELKELENNMNQMDLTDYNCIMYCKKQISILQAKFGIKNTFFLASYQAFLELYRNIYIHEMMEYEEPVIKK